MPPSAPDARRARVLYLLVASVVPCLVVAWANGIFTYNHFYATGPFIHDSGWFSHIVFRQGFSPSNPPVADTHPHYFSFHLSLIVSVGSLASYLFPGDRVGWYCVFQAAIYAPLGAAVALLVPPASRPRTLLRIAGIGAGAIAFAFDGPAFAAMGFPHFEILISAGICIMVAGLATSRPLLAWAGLAIAVATREDGGAHAATFLVVILTCDLLGRPFPVARRRLVLMSVVALGTTFVMMLVQKKVFDATPLFQREYLGDPIYAHLSRAEVQRRLVDLGDRALFLVLPLALSTLLAAIDRDARWLLGWAATLPWLLLNLFAHQALKAYFGLYTGFPFVASIFWLGAYARVKYGSEVRARQLLLRLTSVSALSTVGAFASYPGPSIAIFVAMLRPADVDAPAIRSYARGLRASGAEHGRLLVDPAMASWLTESLGPYAVNHHDTMRYDFSAYDAFTFFSTSQLGAAEHTLIVNGHYTQCSALPRTAIVYCSRAGMPTPSGFVPVAFLRSMLTITELARRDASDGVVVSATGFQQLAVYGPFMPLDPGRYRASFVVRMGDCPLIAAPHAEVEIFARGRVLGTGALRVPAGTIDVDFDVPRPSRFEDVELRAFTGSCPYTIDAVELVSITADSPR